MFKKAAFVLTMMVLLAISLPAMTQEFPDVPPDHWAYQAVQELVNAGIVQGYPDGTYGGKRAMTRYEFAEALAKAIPVIVAQVPAGAGGTGACGPQGPAGPQGPPGVTPEQLQAMQKLIDEFRDELAALGVDVEALRRDVAALNERMTAVEAELARVRLSGVGDVIGRGEVRNSAVPAFDRDSRSLSVGSTTATDAKNPLTNSAVFENFEFGIKAKAGEGANLNALINAGNYMNFVLNPGGNITTVDGLADFLLWNMNADVAMKGGPLGAVQIVAGRQSFQLTPLTMKFVDPDSYTYVPILDSGDFVFDGARVTFNLGTVGLTAFADKANGIGGTTLLNPTLQTAGAGLAITQVAGARAVIGTPLNGNLGLTWYQAGLAPTNGRTNIFGADLNATIAKIGISGEYAKSDPNDAPALAGLGGDNFAWNANLAYSFGKLGIGGGYLQVKQNYNAPGYWLRSGRAVNLQNIKGATANLNYTLSNRLSLVAEGQFLQPDNTGVAVTAREAVLQGQPVSVGGAALDQMTYWRAGLKYGLTSVNSVDLGWEEGLWSPTGAGADTKEQYVTIGLGHSFNANSSMKLLYQIVDFTAGAANPYGNASYRGGLAGAQFELKY